MDREPPVEALMLIIARDALRIGGHVRFVITLAALAAFDGPACATSPDAQLEIHYSPEERLDRIDADLIATAKTTIDLASYSVTDPVVVDTLNAAEAS
jgi:hypothetical protein